MQNTKEKQVKFLEMLKPAQLCTSRYYGKDVGPGLLKKIQRLIRYKSKYIRYLLARSKIYTSQLVSVKNFWRGSIFVSLLDASDSSIFYCGICSAEEYKLTKFLIKNLKEDDIFYDIGAHVGFYSLLAKEFITNGEIHAFEPAPRTIECLEKSFSINKKGNIFLNKFALSDKTGRIQFYDKSVGPGDGSGSSTMIREVIAGDDPSGYQNITIEAVSLDQYLKNHFFPSVLKIDVEGAEVQVLKGGKQFLSKESPIIIMEIWGGERGRCFSSPAINMLYSLGYNSYKITKDGNLDYFKKIQPEQDVLGKWDNFVFKRL